ncbi:hypothetical protein ARMGADRAFT_1171967 [Armillaria gallica]|uniref:Uncharacterized protein n=1 Tax=Armillaria gallica TaxID=47427 RepID=A0A2H3CPF9_ARMGA|nr:hypothetical protein ARMGADRAFT_1171967 [Armillaria gallica]
MSIEGQVQDGNTETDVSGLMKAASRLQPLGKEPHILPLYGAKRRDKDDSICGVVRISYVVAIDSADLEYEGSYELSIVVPMGRFYSTKDKLMRERREKKYAHTRLQFTQSVRTNLFPVSCKSASSGPSNNRNGPRTLCNWPVRRTKSAPRMQSNDLGSFTHETRLRWESGKRYETCFLLYTGLVSLHSKIHSMKASELQSSIVCFNYFLSTGSCMAHEDSIILLRRRLFVPTKVMQKKLLRSCKQENAYQSDVVSVCGCISKSRMYLSVLPSLEIESRSGQHVTSYRRTAPLRHVRRDSVLIYVPVTLKGETLLAFSDGFGA